MSGSQDAFLLRYRYPNGHLQAGIPLWRVEDAAHRRVGWLPSGTEVSYWSLPDGRDPRSLPLEERFTADLTTGRRRWNGSDVLRVLFHDRPYQVLHFWKDGVFTHWYVNFETPGRWTGRVIESRDWHLDLCIDIHGNGAWKDEDEAALAVAHGQIAEHELQVVRESGDTIMADFDRWLTDIGDWRDFSPRADWHPLALPPSWKTATRWRSAPLGSAVPSDHVAATRVRGCATPVMPCGAQGSCLPVQPGPTRLLVSGATTNGRTSHGSGQEQC